MERSASGMPARLRSLDAATSNALSFTKPVGSSAPTCIVGQRCRI
jgi:hypothetical protein